ncbi:MAG: glycine/sarcosine/betaine reductase complex component C subunit beta [Methylocystaceae bacterium]
MAFPVLKAVSNILVHAPEMLQYGTTLEQERHKNPESNLLKEYKNHIRNFVQVIGYAPNQVYVGNISPLELKNITQPWYENLITQASDQGKIGEIVDQSIFYGVLKVVDTFELVLITRQFADSVKDVINQRAYFSDKHMAALDKTNKIDEITSLVDKQQALPLFLNDELIGCVREAHETDLNLSAHVMLENLCTKASGVIAVSNLLKKNEIDPTTVDYFMETSEEAVGDMNQRGGGNMAKAVGEFCGLVNATGSDVRGFCAAPAHGILHAAALVQAGVFKNVLVFAGGSLAKLAMNGRDHVNKNLPLLEDCIGGFALMISENDGVSPVFRTDIVGRHLISSGAAPQAVMQAIVVDPLDKAGIRLTDIDYYAPELQNPEITVPAGAGDVPLANYKMIGAMAVKRGEIDKTALNNLVDKIGMTGFAPTQGHIPSGVPALGFFREILMAGGARRCMIIGKGSLFLGRMTDLFDGISIVIEANQVAPPETAVDISSVKSEIMSMLGEVLEKAAQELAGR